MDARTARTLSSRAVSVRFEGLVALDGVDVELRRGEVLGLIGPNGAGKTTLVNVLTGFQAPSGGGVFIDGAEVTGWPAHRLARAGLARTFQGARLFADMTVLENVELGAVGAGIERRRAQARAREVLEWLGLSERSRVPAGTLPFGEERWVGLARALAGGPRFLLLDEPAAGLDDAESNRLMDVVSVIRAQSGCGVLIIEHDVQLVMSLCDRVHVLNHGRTIGAGTPEEVRGDPEVRRAYLGHTDGAGEAARPRGPRRTPPDGDEPLLGIRRLAVNYGPVRALRGVSLELHQGEMIAVVGPNGAGKSTLINAVSGLVRPAGGGIEFAGRNLGDLAPERIVGGGIAQVPEGRHVFASLTVEENLIVGSAAAGGPRAVAPRLAEVLEMFPILAERYRSPAGKLSGGEQQQLVIARALLAGPELLLLDEPSLGLAPRLIDLVFDTLVRMRDNGLSILLVEQNTARAMEVTDRTYVLRNGAVTLSGPSEELAGDTRFDEAYFGFAAER